MSNTQQNIPYDLFAPFGTTGPALKTLLDTYLAELQGKVTALQQEADRLLQENAQLCATQAVPVAPAPNHSSPLAALVEAIKALSLDCKTDACMPDMFSGEPAKVKSLLMAAQTYFSIKP